MKGEVEIDGKKFAVDFGVYHDLSIRVSRNPQVEAFYIPNASLTPLQIGNF